MSKRTLFVWGRKFGTITLLLGATKNTTPEPKQSPYYQPERKSSAGALAFALLVIALYLLAKYYGWVE